jgi:hypothetical protein
LVQEVRVGASWDFFISYANADRDPEWAQWIAQVLENEGYSCRLQAWDIGSGANFALDMDRFLRDSARLILVLSPDYLAGRPMVDAEWAAKFVEDPNGRSRLLIPIMVRGCKPSGLLGPVTYTPIFDLDEDKAKETLLSAVRKGRRKPSMPVPFPG